MNLTWHIAKKDAHRFRIPIIAWALTLLAGTLSDATIISGELPASWHYTISNFSRMIGWALTIVLSAKIILEDSLTTTTVFWRTRPISGPRLLTAKAVGLGVLIFFPLTLYLTLLIGVGVGGRDLGLAMAEAGLWRVLVVVSVATLAAISNSFGSFSMRALAVILGAGFIASTTGTAVWAYRSALGVAPSTDTLAVSAAIAGTSLAIALGGGLLALRYFSRQTRFAVVSVFVSALLAMLTPLRWSWDFVGKSRYPSVASTGAEPLLFGMISSALKISTSETYQKLGRTKLNRVIGQIEARLLPGGEWVVPQTVYGVELRGTDEKKIPTSPFLNQPAGGGESLAALEPESLQTCLAPLRLMNAQRKQTFGLGLFTLPGMVRVPDTPLQLRAYLDARRYRFSIEAEVPAFSGGTAGNNRLRIRVEDLIIQDHELTLWIRDREFQPSMLGGNLGFNPLQPTSFGRPPRPSESVLYVLANRARDEAVLLRNGNSQRSSLGDMSTGQTSLHFRPDSIETIPDSSWLKDATLLRIRAIEQGPITCRLEVGDLTIKN